MMLTALTLSCKTFNTTDLGNISCLGQGLAGRYVPFCFKADFYQTRTECRSSWNVDTSTGGRSHICSVYLSVAANTLSLPLPVFSNPSPLSLPLSIGLDRPRYAGGLSGRPTRRLPRPLRTRSPSPQVATLHRATTTSRRTPLRQHRTRLISEHILTEHVPEHALRHGAPAAETSTPASASHRGPPSQRQGLRVRAARSQVELTADGAASD